MTEEKTSVGFASPADVKEGVEPDEEKPWGDDELERQKYAKPLTNLVISTKGEPFCIAVDGEWGSGKTFFLKRWRAEFSTQSNNVVYFNAWEDDFYADPLTAIIGQLWNELEKGKMENIGNMSKEDWWNIAKEATLNLSCSGVKLGDFQSSARKTIEEYLKRQENINILQKQLQGLADATKKNTKKPLVFIVDELDRCRPTFAIELLERVKHIVGVPGIVFVFGINQKELEESIKSIYGEIGATDYLRKFFHISMTLPQAEASKYCTSLIKEHKIKEAIGESNVHRRQPKGWESYWYDFVENMPIMVSLLGLSLRQIEQAIRMLLVVLYSKEVADEDERITLQAEDCFGVFILLRIKDRDLYERFINEDYSIKIAMDKMLHFLPKDKVGNYPSPELMICIYRIVSAFYLCYGIEEYDGIVQELHAVRDLKELTQERFVPKIIVEMENKNMRGKSADNLSRWVAYTLEARRRGDGIHRLPIQQRIARFLEWGDNWQS